MEIQIAEFSNEGCKIRKIFARESIYPKEIFEFLRIGLMGCPRAKCFFQFGSKR